MVLSTLKFPGSMLKHTVLLFIYDDDILYMSKTKQVYERFWDLLKTELKIKELGKPKHILGVSVEFVKNGISLSQRHFSEEIVRTFSFRTGNKVHTPMEPHSTPKSVCNRKMKHSILIRTASSLEVWCSSLPGQDQTFHNQCQFFPNSFQVQLEDTGHWLEE